MKTEALEKILQLPHPWLSDGVAEARHELAFLISAAELCESLAIDLAATKEENKRLEATLIKVADWKRHWEDANERCKELAAELATARLRIAELEAERLGKVPTLTEQPQGQSDFDRKAAVWAAKEPAASIMESWKDRATQAEEALTEIIFVAEDRLKMATTPLQPPAVSEKKISSVPREDGAFRPTEVYEEPSAASETVPMSSTQQIVGYIATILKRLEALEQAATKPPMPEVADEINRQFSDVSYAALINNLRRLNDTVFAPAKEELTS